MAYLLQPDYVNYACSCGKLKPIVNIYFCRHCLKIRCSYCICHEVDSHYCGNCFENMPSSEARLKKNRCGSCFDCPSCFHTLSTRASVQSKTNAGDGDKSDARIPKKSYYFSCFNCRWTSRDVGIPDQSVATGGWPERTNVYLQRINELADYYKGLALQEKQEKMEKERKKISIRGKYITLTDKIGLTAAMARGRAGIGDSSNVSNMGGVLQFMPSIASDEVEELPQNIFSQKIKLENMTNMGQRLAVPDFQPETVDKLYPLQKQLIIKRSQRCRQCDHNVTKPEYNPGSIKFKIELLAYYHVPEVRIISCGVLHPGKPGQILVKLTNPTGHEMTVNFLPLPSREEHIAEIEIIKQLSKTQIQEIGTPSLLPSLSRGAWTAVDPKPVCCDVSASIGLPANPLRLPQRDDASEYDDDTNNYNDDPSLVLWRKSNKIALKLEVTPSSQLQRDDRVCVGFTLQYTYINTVTNNPDKKQPQEHVLKASVYLNLGPILS